MMENKHYNPAEVEDKWYRFWVNNGYFNSVPDEREPYTIVIPPPNVTGMLHMGHMLNNTIQDVLIRKARMEGKNACWVPGTDHASIATEAKVVQMLKEKGIQKKDISREEFMQHAWNWKEKYGGIILDQLKKLGASCDWNRTRFTMEPDLSKAVIHAFVNLHRKGMIYRDTKMVNWDPAGKTTLSDEEVVYKETNTALYHIHYALTHTDEFITIATTRPETLLGDTAICVNPDDERYRHLVGKKAVVPFVNRVVPIIADPYVESDFGTGCLKVTPAHDINDYNLGVTHGLEILDVLNEDGTIRYPGLKYNGMDRFEARKEIIKDLKAMGQLAEVKQILNKVGHSERTDAIIEPRISTQWFLNMKKFMDKNPEVLESVMQNDIRFFPDKFKNTYKHWLDNIKDWNISRQLWWGHRIPAWYDDEGLCVVAENEDQARKLYAKTHGKMAQLHQDEDVLDTWFSSWLWPISVFNGMESDSKDFSYYYPTSDLVTGPDILFFWVARMIMAGYEFAQKKPFTNVYFTGIVRDKQRRKMSKSLGNSPDPLELIAQYGADGTRMGILLSAPAGNDILFDEALVEQGRNFCNKIWNAAKLIQSWNPESHDNTDVRKSDITAHKWFSEHRNTIIWEVHQAFDQYRLSDALMKLYKLVWDDFCSWYLEMIKPTPGQPIHSDTLKECKEHFACLLRMLHPFMPFITEDLYHDMHQGHPDKPLVISIYPTVASTTITTPDSRAIQLISEVRNLRAAKGIAYKETLHLVVNAQDNQTYRDFEWVLKKLANVHIQWNQSLTSDHAVILVDKDEIGVEVSAYMDVKAEMEKIQQEIHYLKGFLTSVNAKLENERFMKNAKPEVIEKEQQKRADALSKMNTLTLSLQKWQSQS
jgi:valyl-tRNA synthetase